VAREMTADEEEYLQELARRYDCPEFLPFDRQPGRCPRCGTTLAGRQRRWCSVKCQNEWRAQHDWGSARNAAKRRDGHRCTRPGCGVTTRLEVNHIEPRAGRGYGWGCHNHASNLETLCKAHHQEVTNQQRDGRKAVGHIDWFERTGHCGGCGQPGAYCLCTDARPCGCRHLHAMGSGRDADPIELFAVPIDDNQGELFA
jgi:hypothetical protein